MTPRCRCPDAENLDLTPTDRAARIITLLARGQSMTAPEIARCTGLQLTSVPKFMRRLSLHAPIYCERGRWRWLAGAETGHSFDSAKIIVTAQKLGVRWKDAFDQYVAQGYGKVPQPPKWRYVYILDRSDRALRARVAELAVPYPKREGSVTGGNVECPA